MTRAVLVNFHKYQPYGGEFYEPILSHFLQQMQKFKNEYDKLYILDSTWGITPATYILPSNVIIIKVNSSLRYYDAYKEVLPQIKEELVLFMDNDMLVWKEGKIEETFKKLQECDVVSIYDTIGTWHTDKMNSKNKFCPYWFATRKELLLKYVNIDWSPDNMPHYETLGLLTHKMIEDGIKAFEWEEDKSDITMENNIILRRPLEGKKLGYYHIRSGSVPAVLLAYKKYDPEKYWDYIRTQPKREYLRQIMWYWYMGGDPVAILDMVLDMDVAQDSWNRYYEQFLLYHGL